MKTIMVIDAALNCAYDCFGVEDDLFRLIFPGPGQDIEFIEDYAVRMADPSTPAKVRRYADDQWPKVWQNRVDRRRVTGIDGLLFYELTVKRPYYPNKRDSDLDGKGRPSP